MNKFIIITSLLLFSKTSFSTCTETETFKLGFDTSKVNTALNELTNSPVNNLGTSIYEETINLEANYFCIAATSLHLTNQRFIQKILKNFKIINSYVNKYGDQEAKDLLSLNQDRAKTARPEFYDQSIFKTKYPAITKAQKDCVRWYAMSDETKTLILKDMQKVFGIHYQASLYLQQQSNAINKAYASAKLTCNISL